MTTRTPTRAPTRLFAAGPVVVGVLLEGEPQAAEVLGAFPTAVYLRLDAGQVLAVLARDAVHLPLGLVLPVDSSRHPLDRWSGPVTVGRGVVQTSAWSVRMSRTISVVAPAGLRPNGEAVTRAAGWLGRRADGLPGAERLAVASRRGDRAGSSEAVRQLLGAGPGLTPAGDDVLAGFLVGAWSFDLQVHHVRTAVFESAPTRTTSLSAALLTCAAHGGSIPQVTTLLHTIGHADTGDDVAVSRLEEALGALARVGHSSGVALALGVVAAAGSAARAQVRSPSARPGAG